MAKTTYPYVSQEFLDFMEAQEALRQWYFDNRGRNTQPPKNLFDRLHETHRKYEKSKRNTNA